MDKDFGEVKKLDVNINGEDFKHSIQRVYIQIDPLALTGSGYIDVLDTTDKIKNIKVGDIVNVSLESTDGTFNGEFKITSFDKIVKTQAKTQIYRMLILHKSFCKNFESPMTKTWQNEGVKGIISELLDMMGMKLGEIDGGFGSRKVTYTCANKTPLIAIYELCKIQADIFPFLEEFSGTPKVKFKPVADWDTCEEKIDTEIKGTDLITSKSDISKKDSKKYASYRMEKGSYFEQAVTGITGATNHIYDYTNKKYTKESVGDFPKNTMKSTFKQKNLYTQGGANPTIEDSYTFIKRREYLKHFVQVPSFSFQLGGWLDVVENLGKKNNTGDVVFYKEDGSSENTQRGEKDQNLSNREYIFKRISINASPTEIYTVVEVLPTEGDY